MSYGCIDNKCPCRKCDKRHITCHVSCEPYLEWAVEKRSYSQKATEAWKIENSIRIIRDRGVKNAKAGAGRAKTKEGVRH